MDARWDPQSLFVGPVAPRPRGVEQREPGLDPYYRWAVHTQWRGFMRVARLGQTRPDQPDLRIIARAPHDLDLAQLRKDPVFSKANAIANVYHNPLPGQRSPTRHFTAHVAFEDQQALVDNPHGLLWKLALPLRDALASAEASSRGLHGPDRDGRDMQANNVVAKAVAAARKRRSAPPEAAMLDAGVAVLDFGCPFLHEHFGTPAGTRIHALWDQGSPLGSPLTSQPSNSWPWDVPPGFMQGRELQPDMLDAINLAVRRKGGPEESLAYRGIDHLIDYDDPRRRLWRATHGGHVFDMAGGSVDPVTGEGDHAAMAPLIFVQLPSLTAMDSAGGSLAAQLLDGVRYAMSLVASGKPLVVVISYGNCAGPHDGTSLIESALDELLEQRQNNFAIVLAAGNSRRDQGHARRAVAKDRSALLRLQLAPGDTTDTFVEAWYPRSGAPLQVRMRGPDRVWSAWIGQAEEQLLRAGTTDQEVVAMIRHDRFAPNGDGAQVLLAFAPTTEPAGIECRLCEAGVWEIEFRLADPKGTSVELHAWVERDDPAPHTSSPHTHFIDQLIDDEFETTSSIANGTHTIKAFGFNAQSRRPAPYSALPSNARLCVGTEALQVMAACEEDEVNRDFAAAATRSEETYRMRGTSVAAPVLARRLFNAMVDLEGNETMERGDWVSLLDYLVAAHSGDPAVQELRKE